MGLREGKDGAAEVSEIGRESLAIVLASGSGCRVRSGVRAGAPARLGEFAALESVALGVFRGMGMTKNNGRLLCGRDIGRCELDFARSTRSILGGRGAPGQTGEQTRGENK